VMERDKKPSHATVPLKDCLLNPKRTLSTTSYSNVSRNYLSIVRLLVFTELVQRYKFSFDPDWDLFPKFSKKLGPDTKTIILYPQYVYICSKPEDRVF